ncbi:MAG TPA: NUDIX hydrolase [Xanthobacteraceae bacterium]|nr:NUDIX hydrolase [Xanthobacteraceae bacterium]
MANIEIGTLDRADITFEPWAWPFAARRRREIDANFARLQRERAGVWNGRVVMLNRYDVSAGVLRGTCFETDYASFCAWRDWAPADSGAFNVFAAAAILTVDGAYLIGEMGPDTAGAGRLYFPCGTPEPDDLDAAGRLDLEGNVRRELLEETGLDAGELAADAGFCLVHDGGYIALLKTLRTRQRAQEVRDRIMRHLAGEERPELVDIRILRSAADFDPAMPRFVTAFLTRCWS